MNRPRILTALLALFFVAGAAATAQPMTVYFGTYTGPKSKGIYVAKFDPATGSLTTPEVAAEIKNPSFLTARNAVLRAFGSMKGSGRLTDDEYAAVRGAAWEAFARFGMGFDASCPNATFSGCRGGTARPPDGVDD